MSPPNSDDSTGGLGALLGGYGSDDSADLGDGQKAGTMAPPGPVPRGADAGASGDARKSPNTDTHVIENPDDGLDPVPSGPSRGPPVPSEGAAPVGFEEEGHRAAVANDDAPMTGPSRPAPGDVENAHAAYPERTQDGAGMAGVSGTLAPPDPASIATRSPRVKHSAPAVYLEGVKIPEAAVQDADEVDTSTSSTTSGIHQKLNKWMQLKRNGVNVNSTLRKSKGFRNPDFLQSAVRHFAIDERATHFSKDVFDPNGYARDDFYDTLAQQQKRLAEKKERERKDLGPNRVVEFRTAAAERAAAAAAAAAEAIHKRRKK